MPCMAQLHITRAISSAISIWQMSGCAPRCASPSYGDAHDLDVGDPSATLAACNASHMSLSAIVRSSLAHHRTDSMVWAMPLLAHAVPNATGSMVWAIPLARYARHWIRYSLGQRYHWRMVASLALESMSVALSTRARDDAALCSMMSPRTHASTAVSGCRMRAGPH